MGELKRQNEGGEGEREESHGKREKIFLNKKYFF